MFFKKKNLPGQELLGAIDNLRRLLIKYTEKERMAEVCLKDLEPIFQSIEKGKTDLPMKKNPRSWDFTEGVLRQYGELEHAYANFSLLATGYDMDKLHEYSKKLESGAYIEKMPLERTDLDNYSSQEWAKILLAYAGEHDYLYAYDLGQSWLIAHPGDSDVLEALILTGAKLAAHISETQETGSPDVSNQIANHQELSLRIKKLIAKHKN